jgi:hypothetical protein
MSCLILILASTALRSQMEVGDAYFKLVNEKEVEIVTLPALVKRAKLSWVYTKAVIQEYRENSYLADPFVKHEACLKGWVSLQLEVNGEMFLLSLWAEGLSWSNLDYMKQLYITYGRVFSSSFVSRWF